MGADRLATDSPCELHVVLMAWYGNFDIISVHLTRVCQPSATQLALGAMYYLVPILIGC